MRVARGSRRAASAVAVLLVVASLLAGPVAAQVGSGGDEATVEVSRLSGADRYATSLAVAEAVAAGRGGQLDRVVIVSGERWRDAVVAASLSSLGDTGHAPVLLSHPSLGLSADAWAFLERTGVSDAEIVSTGTGTDAAVPAAVDAAGRDRGIGVRRHSGADAYATSVAVASRVAGSAGVSRLPGDSADLGRTVFVASGEASADALVAGPLLAGPQRWGTGPYALLLTPKDRLDAGVAAWMGEHEPHRAVILGGTAAVSAAVEAQIKAAGVQVDRIAGRDRFDTAAQIATWAAGRRSGCIGAGEVGLARADVPFDSFSAGPLLASRCAPLLLAEKGRIPDATAAALDAMRASRGRHRTVLLNVFGGESAVSTAAVDAWLDPADSAGDGITVAEAEQQMVALVNSLRAGLGLGALAVRAELTGVARGWSQTMLATGDFEHNPDYSGQYPQGFTVAAENVATVWGGVALADAVRTMFDGLVDSPGHYANMADARFTHVGIGIARSGIKVYATQNFAAYPQGTNNQGPASAPGSSATAELDAPPALTAAVAAAAGTPSSVGSSARVSWRDQSPIRPKKGSETVTVFVCDAAGGAQGSAARAAAATLNERLGPFYAWASSGEFKFVFKAGAVLTPSAGSTCTETIEKRKLADSYVMIVRSVAGQTAQGFGWAGARASKAATVVGSDGPTGLEQTVPGESLWRRDYHLISVIDALAHTHLGIGFNNARFSEDLTDFLGCGNGRRGRLENDGVGWQHAGNPRGYRYLLACWDMKALGWPRREGNCALLRAEPPTIESFEIGEGSAKLVWSAPPVRPWSHPLAGYRVEYYERRTGDEAGYFLPVETHSLSASAREFTLTGLSHTRSYGLQLQALYEEQSDPFTGPTSISSPYNPLAYPYRSFRPKAKSSVVHFEVIAPRLRYQPAEITPALMGYRMTWDPHPEAAHYAITGLGERPYSRLPNDEIHSYTGTLATTNQYIIDGLIDQLAFDTAYEIVVIACVRNPSFGTRPGEPACLDFEYVNTEWATPTKEEFTERFYPTTQTTSGSVGTWDEARRNLVQNVRITTALVHTHTPGELRPRITLTWDSVPGALLYRMINPWHDPSIPYDIHDPSKPLDVDDDLLRPELQSHTNRLSTYLHADYGDTVTFKRVVACGRAPGSTLDEHGPLHLVCGEPVDVDLVMPRP